MYLDQLARIGEEKSYIRSQTEALRKENQKRAQMLQRNIDIQEIRNLMGRFSIYYSAGRYADAFSLFTETDAAYLDRSDVGVYQGRDSVKRYFDQLQEDAVAGSFRMMPIDTEAIEIAGDRRTAQGMWYITGIEAIKDPKNPAVPAADMWINDKLAVEFVLENGRWVILRLNVTEEVRARYHKSWGEYAVEPDYPEFDVFAKPDRGSTHHNPFRADRKSMKNLTTPEAHQTYADLRDHF